MSARRQSIEFPTKNFKEAVDDAPKPLQNSGEWPKLSLTETRLPWNFPARSNSFFCVISCSLEAWSSNITGKRSPLPSSVRGGSKRTTGWRSSRLWQGVREEVSLGLLILPLLFKLLHCLPIDSAWSVVPPYRPKGNSQIPRSVHFVPESEAFGCRLTYLRAVLACGQSTFNVPPKAIGLGFLQLAERGLSPSLSPVQFCSVHSSWIFRIHLSPSLGSTGVTRFFRVCLHRRTSPAL